MSSGMPNILQLCKQCWSRRCCILLRRTLAHIKERDHAVDIPQTYLAATSHVPPPPRGEVDTTIQRHNGADPMLRTDRGQCARALADARMDIANWTQGAVLGFGRNNQTKPMAIFFLHLCYKKLQGQQLLQFVLGWKICTSAL